MLRTLKLQALGYKLTVTELVGWEHSMKNELIVASRPAQRDGAGQRRAAAQLQAMLDSLGLPELQQRFGIGRND